MNIIERNKKISKSRILRKKRLGYLNSKETREKISKSLKGKPSNVGEKNGMWKDGRTKDPKYRSKDAARWNRENGEKRKIIQKRYRLNNKDKVKALNSYHTVLRRGVGGSFTAKEWELVKEKHNNRCVDCGMTELECLQNDGVGLTVDHKIPVTRWFEFLKTHPEIDYKCNDIINIQPLCLKCNIIKGNRRIDYKQ